MLKTPPHLPKTSSLKTGQGTKKEKLTHHEKWCYSESCLGAICMRQFRLECAIVKILSKIPGASDNQG